MHCWLWGIVNHFMYTSIVTNMDISWQWSAWTNCISDWPCFVDHTCIYTQEHVLDYYCNISSPWSSLNSNASYKNSCLVDLRVYELACMTLTSCISLWPCLWLELPHKCSNRIVRQKYQWSSNFITINQCMVIFNISAFQSI